MDWLRTAVIMRGKDKPKLKIYSLIKIKCVSLIFLILISVEKF